MRKPWPRWLGIVWAQDYFECDFTSRELDSISLYSGDQHISYSKDSWWLAWHVFGHKVEGTASCQPVIRLVPAKREGIKLDCSRMSRSFNNHQNRKEVVVDWRLGLLLVNEAAFGVPCRLIGITAGRARVSNSWSHELTCPPHDDWGLT